MSRHTARDLVHELVDHLPERALPKAEVVLSTILRWEMLLWAIRVSVPQPARGPKSGDGVGRVIRPEPRAEERSVG